MKRKTDAAPRALRPPCRLACLAMVGMAALAPPPAAAQVRVEAVAGQPLGVGVVQVRAPGGDAAVIVRDDDGRVLYPAMRPQPVRRLLSDLLNVEIDGPSDVETYFLFRGDGPLALRIEVAGAEQSVRVSPGRRSGDFRRLLRDWWDAYREPSRPLARRDSYPADVENYLMLMLARRLDLDPVGPPPSALLGDELDVALGPLLGTETARLRIVRRTMLDEHAEVGLAADELPASGLPPLPIPAPAEDVAVEPLAGRVPCECFYVRFGRFSDYLWLSDTLERIEGDVRNVVGAGGLDRRLRAGLQDRLALRPTLLAELFGDLVISDVALFGTDLLLRDGPAIGMLFEAGNGAALAGQIAAQRRQALEENPGAEETTVEIAGRQVSLVASPDGAVRSYYAVDGDYHCVATSRRLLRRFFEASAGEGALAAEPSLLQARLAAPAERRDAVFAHFSDAFVREFTAPRYRIELVRRLEAAVAIELAELAGLAAAAEGRECRSLDDLVAAGLLPAGFGRRPDGSTTVIEGNTVYDSLRGQRGGFLPVPDVDVPAATAAERADYARFAAFYRRPWARPEPFTVVVQRQASQEGVEHVTVQATFAPLSPEKRGLLAARLGAASDVRYAPIDGDLVAAELVLADEHLFAGLRGLGPAARALFAPTAPGDVLASPIGRLITTRPEDYVHGYVGTTGARLPPLVDEEDFSTTDAQGYSRTEETLWRFQSDGLTVYSLHGWLLEEVAPYLAARAAVRPAQARLAIADLAGTDAGDLVDRYAFEQALRASRGNARLLNAIVDQFHLPPAEALPIAEALLGARLECPLGGRYVLDESGTVGRWTSTALVEPAGGTPPAPGGRSPVAWLRGLEADAAVDDNAARLHLEVWINAAPEDGGDPFAE